MENHHFQWVNQLFQWAIFNSNVTNYQRVWQANINIHWLVVYLTL